MDFSAIDVNNGDCKAIGVAWNNEEAFAVRNLGIPADFVRKGIYTIEDYEKELGSKPKAKKEVIEVVENEEKDEVVSSEEIDINELKAKYKEKYGKNIPPVKLKDIEWIVGKLNE